MKTLFLIAALVIAPFCTAHAKDPDQCKKISELAGDAMKSRQDGELLEDAISTVGDGSKFSEGMVMKAYQVRVFADQAEKKAAIAEFKNGAYRECYEAHN